jgi:hypothetical protein
VPVVWILAGGALLLAGAVVLYSFNPVTARFYPPCPFHKLTGLYCPGCGSTRALHLLLHGHVAAAFDLNPLAVVMLPLVVVGVAREVWQMTRRDARPVTRRVPAGAVWALLVVVVLFGIARNLPWGPVRWMAP